MEQTAVVRPPAATASTLFPNGAGSSATPTDAPSVVAEPMATTPEELARAAAELAELVEHHRRELVDTMAELTRLQRVLRSETRAAIEAIRGAAQMHPSDSGAGSVASADQTGGPAEP